jgi:tetratricopeptide (TPR) repeat protein
MLPARAQRLLTLALLLGAAATALVWLGWFAWRSPRSRFLPPDAAAEWVHYPVAPQVATFAFRYEQHAIFRHTFALAEVPPWARLRVRAFQACSVQLNGRAVELPAAEHWKQVRTCDVAPLLRAGPNDIRAVVVNDVGPAVLWLSLEGPGWSVASDAGWQTSLDGAAECPAHPARQPLPVRPGSGAAGGPRTVASFRARLPTLLLFAGLSAAALLLVHLAARRGLSPGFFGHPLSPLAAATLAAGLFWVVLFANNTFLAPRFPCGFDATAHLQYVQFLLDHGTLPLAEEGWEAHQPPLFYVVAACLLRLGGLSTTDEGAVVVLRLLGLAAGLAQLALLAACLQLLFPEQPRRQVAGLALAAFLPAQLYTCHYVTNEWLLTALGTAALYLGLRACRDERPAPARQALLGLCLGAALLTKVTAVVVAGVLLLVLAGRLAVRRERRPGAWLCGVGLPLLVAAAVSGWYYVRVWVHFGTPLVGNFDPASGFQWWQPPGYGTLAYLGRCGRALTDPFFSALHGLPDGLYSTLWGDGLCGGAGAWPHRQPWNYDLMAAGFLLALVPSLAVVLGLAVALGQLLRRPRAEWVLLFGVAGGLAVAVLYQFLRYPYYGHARASYLLTGMLPLAAFSAVGLDWLARLGRAPAALLVILLGTWAGTAYASFWIDPGGAATHNWAGDQYLRDGSYYRARAGFRKALEADPHSVPARLNLVRSLLPTGDMAEARRVIDAVLRDAPDDPDALLLLAAVSQAKGRVGDSLAPLQRASELAPDHPAMYPMLGDALMAQKRDEEAVAAYRQALRVEPWNPADHANLGLLLARVGQTEEALAQYRLAIDVYPGQPDWLADVAWILATQEDPRFRDPEEALRLAEEACRRSQDRSAAPLQSLAAAQAACGRYGEARDTAVRAAQAAADTGMSDLVRPLLEQLQCYEKGKPFYARAPLRTRPYATAPADQWPASAKPTR